MPRRVGLVGCVKTKLFTAAPAAELYTSALFRGRRAFVERTCERWFILSARYGLVNPLQEIEPYDETLAGKSAHERRRWSDAVLGELEGRLRPLDRRVFEIHAGAAYRDSGLSEGLRLRGAAVEVPAIGLSQGQQLAFYSKRPATLATLRAARAGRYEGLAKHLECVGASSTTLTLSEIERILGADLPRSAREHRAWWANDPHHSQARAWLEVGWRVRSVRLGAEATFWRPEP